MLPETGKISLDNVRNELNIKGSISLGDINVRRLAGQDIPPQPQECDYYFETREDFDARRDAIIAENNNDLSQKTFGFGDSVTSLENAFKQTKITSTPKMIVAKNVNELSRCFYGCSSLTLISEKLFDNCMNAISFDNCFGFCESLILIPHGLFDNCTKVSNFNGSFSSCSFLTTVPFYLFDNCPNVTDFSWCFFDCLDITSALPDVWNKKKFSKVTSGNYYACDCKKAANYNEIPADFK